MHVKLIHITPEAEKHIAYCARVSSHNQENPEYAKLLRYMIEHKHWSPFEMASMCIEIETSRAISAQILRHRSFSFQEFCISGDSKITTILPSNGLPNYIPIEKLYKRQNWKNYKEVSIRVYDENKGEFTTAKLKEVFKAGVKDCFKVFFEDGKSIVCTKEHRFLTKEGFLSLEEATGLKVIGKTVAIEKNSEFGVNGIPCYQSYDWLKKSKEESIKNGSGLNGIALNANVSVHTIRKWLKKLSLNFTKREVNQYSPIWNKGKTGYKIRPRTLAQKEHMKSITPKGKDHHSWKGGGAAERKSIANYFNSYRKKIFENFGYKCQLCLTSFNAFDGKIDLHHLKEVALFPELAKEIANVVPVHRKCHMEFHGKSYFFKEIRKGHKGNTLAPKWVKIEKIEYIGPTETYDLEVDHRSHNYVANKIIVHNSQRYREAVDFEPFSVRTQDKKNRQNSIDSFSPEEKAEILYLLKCRASSSMDLYEELLKRGVAKECARMILPMCTKTKLYMHGTVRSWIHYLEVRTNEDTQFEHREIAEACRIIFVEQLPTVAKALQWA